MTHDEYSAALTGDDLHDLSAAYNTAQRVAYDMRFTSAKRAAARLYLPLLAYELRLRLEESRAV